MNKNIAYRSGDGWSDSSYYQYIPLEQMKELEVDDRGNEWFNDTDYLNNGYECIWACPKKKDVRRYGDCIQEIDISNSVPMINDGDGGFLYVRKIK